MSQPLVKISAADLKAAKAARTAPAPKINKSDLIRSLPTSMKASEVVAQAAKQGVKITPGLVYVVRSKKEQPSTTSDGTRRRGRPSNADVLGVPVKKRRGRPPGSKNKPKPGASPAAAPITKAAASAKTAPSLGRGASDAERRLASVVVELGLDRVLELLDGLKRALARV